MTRQIVVTRRSAATLALAAALALAACSGGDEEGDAAGTAAEAQPQSAAPPDGGERVKFVTSDDVIIDATWTPVARDAPALVLVPHTGERSRTDWDGLAVRLREAGFSTLTFDLRGTGASVSRSPDKTRYVPPRDPSAHLLLGERDVRAAVRFVRERGVEDVALLGAGPGANLAWRASGTVPGVRGAVALGPAIAREDLPAGRPRPRAVLVVSPRLQSALGHDLIGATRRPRRVSLAFGERPGVLLLLDEAVSLQVREWLVDRLGLTPVRGS